MESVLVVVWSSGVGALALSHRDCFGNQVLSLGPLSVPLIYLRILKQAPSREFLLQVIIKVETPRIGFRYSGIKLKNNTGTTLSYLRKRENRLQIAF